MNDLTPLIIELYYTPILESVIEGRNYFMLVKYPTVVIKYNVGYPSWWGSYKTDEIYTFIDALQANTHEQLHLSTITMVLYERDIRFIGADNTIIVTNTDTFRKQLTTLLHHYIDEFVWKLDF